MTEFFKHFPPELSSKVAFKMMVHKMCEAEKAFKDNDEYYLTCLDKLKDMITVFIQESA